MASDQQSRFEHKATKDELAGIGKNRRFDEIIDDDENEEIQVICKRGENEITLAKPSRAFYFVDRNLHDQEAQRFDIEMAAEDFRALEDTCRDKVNSTLKSTVEAA